MLTVSHFDFDRPMTFTDLTHDTYSILVRIIFTTTVLASIGTMAIEIPPCKYFKKNILLLKIVICPPKIDTIVGHEDLAYGYQNPTWRWLKTPV